MNFGSGLDKIPWNSMELEVLLLKFHGIPWNHRCCSNVNKKRIHGTLEKVQWNFFGKLKVPWKSMEFHGTREYWKKFQTLDLDKIPCKCTNFADMISSTRSAPISAHVIEIVARHGIPWNCSCQRNWRTPSSTEFHGIPWNSMELLVSAKLAHSKFRGIPWNCWCQFRGIPWNLLFVILWNHWYHH